jgi:carbon monoxide dehydrogenase subunit G
LASIRQEVLLNAPLERVWDALRDVGALHTRLVPGFVTDTRLEEGARVVTFANGMVVRELIVDIDERQHRVCWAAVGTPMTHYNASFQLFAEGGARTRGVWIADLLPHEAAPNVAAMMEQGLQAMRKVF